MRLVTDLVVGRGEVGTALSYVLRDGGWDVIGYDKAKAGYSEIPAHADFVHVCFPYDGAFVDEVRGWQVRLPQSKIVVHSTVPVGTCARLGVVHSPVVGLHPNLAESLTTFTKWVGGPDAGPVAEHLRRAGMRVYVTARSQTTELLKLLCTLRYGVDVEFAREAENLCADEGVPFEAWTLWTRDYNWGYQLMGRPEFTRPVLTAPQDKIGGHCVLPNARLLESEFARLVLDRNGEETDD